MLLLSLVRLFEATIVTCRVVEAEGTLLIGLLTWSLLGLNGADCTLDLNPAV